MSDYTNLLIRAFLAFLALPGVVAFAVPLLLVWGTNHQLRFGIFGLTTMLPGCAGLVWCTWAFYVSGKGTLAPWSPPRSLVTRGLYQYSRNPMYCSVLLILAGWAILFQSMLLAGYGVAVAIAFHLRVVFGEEAWLARTHGEEWSEYKKNVSRWVGKPRHAPPSTV